MRKLLLLSLLTFAFVYSTYAAETEQLAAESDPSATEQQENSAENKAVAAEKDELFGLLAQVDEQYGDVAASLKAIEQEIAQTNISLDKLRKEITTHQANIDRLNAELSGHVKAAYAMGQQDRLKLLLNQQDPVLSSRMMMYYEYINKKRLKKLANLNQMVAYLDQLDGDKLAQTKLLEQRLAVKKTEQTALSDVKKQRNELLAKLNSDSAEAQLSLLKESEHKLISLIKTLEHDASKDEEESETVAAENNSGEYDNFPKLSGDFNSLKGKLPLPVRGKPSKLLAEAASEAVLIPAQEGTDVHAVTNGKVIYSGMFKGYGLLLIVEHDNGFMTLYGFNQSLYKHKGDAVLAGDLIAAVGQSGGRNKPGLYFEIRHLGKAVDLLQWCRG